MRFIQMAVIAGSRGSRISANINDDQIQLHFITSISMRSALAGAFPDPPFKWLFFTRPF